MAGVKAHCASVRDYTGKLVKQGNEPKQSLRTSYGEVTNHRTMSGVREESTLQADSFHRERRKSIGEAGSSYACMCTGRRKGEKINQLQTEERRKGMCERQFQC